MWNTSGYFSGALWIGNISYFLTLNFLLKEYRMCAHISTTHIMYLTNLFLFEILRKKILSNEHEHARIYRLDIINNWWFTLLSNTTDIRIVCFVTIFLVLRVEDYHGGRGELERMIYGSDLLLRWKFNFKFTAIRLKAIYLQFVWVFIWFK